MNADKKRSVILMDDSEVVLHALTAVFEASGWDVRAAANLADLERALEGARPDLFVLDVQMPEMFGDDVAQVLRHVRSLHVPIVLFSDIDERALAERGREAGVDAYVTKRDGVGALMARVGEISGMK